MEIPTVVGRIINDLYDRGVSREAIATAIGIKPSAVSHVKAGRGSIDDSRLAALSELHGGISPQRLRVLKYLEWLEREKGISKSMLMDELMPDAIRKTA